MARPTPATVERAAAARRPLVARPIAALVVICVAVAAFAGLALWVHDTRDPKAIDSAVQNWLQDNTGSFVRRAALIFTEPALTLGCCCGVVALCCLVIRRWDILALAVVGPLAGLVLESYVLKPWINRLYGVVEDVTGGLLKAGRAFPSGHQIGVTSAVVLLCLLALRTSWSARTKTLVLTAGTLWLTVAAFALVINGYHYFTDTVGGILVGTTVMLATAMVIDVVANRLSSPAGRGRTRTAHAA